MKRLLQKSERMRDATSRAISELRSLSVDDLLQQAEALAERRGKQTESWVSGDFHVEHLASGSTYVHCETITEVLRAEYAMLGAWEILIAPDVSARTRVTENFSKFSGLDWAVEHFVVADDGPSFALSAA